MRKLWLGLVLVLGAVALPNFAPDASAGTTTIRLASLAPRGSSWDTIFRAWNNTVKKDTKGTVEFEFFPGGAAGDERDVIRKMKANQMDAGAFTSIGLGQIVRPVSVLQMPGIFKGYADLNRVRDQMAPDFNALFDAEGYKLLGWGDAGFGRVFSKQPILRPSDYKKVRPWIPREDPTTPEMMKMIGANGIPLGIPEVLPALQTGMVDTVIASAIAAVALQWFRHCTHVSKSADVAIVGATVLKKDVFLSLAPDAQEVLAESGKKAHIALIKQVMAEDDRAYKTLLARGMIEFDPFADKAGVAEWQKINADLLKKMTGRLWTQELFDKVKRIADQH